MDFTPALNMLLNALWYLIPLLLIVTLLKSRWFKGALGEFLVNLSLKLFLAKKDYHLIKNVTLPTENGTTQIDHILVSRYGIFVIETKNVKGWIYGSATQKQWTQKIFKYTGRFQNPLHQNYKHTKTLEKLLNVHHEHIHSVIVFVGDSTFKTKMPENVTYSGKCITYIKSKTTVVFSEKHVRDLIYGIEQIRLKRGLVTNLKHTAHVKKVVASKPASKSCAKCDSAMVLRQSKKGAHAGSQFWGCSSFPKCRYTQPAK